MRNVMGSIAQATTPKVKIQQEVLVSDGGFEAWIEADHVGPNHIKTKVNLRAGQFLILGQQALDRTLDPFFWPAGPPRGRDAHAWQNRPAETFLYVILRAEIDRVS